MIVARKRFGQHFLTDPEILQKIVSEFSPDAEDRVVEIGPGTGNLTSVLLEQLNHLVAIELDRDMVDLLARKFPGKPLSVIQQDILKTDLSSLDVPGTGNRLRIIGNLPYNISTPLIFHMIDNANLIRDMHFMVQKEVAQRLSAEVGNRNYGRLSVMTALKLSCRTVLEVPPHAFIPSPAVDSTVVRLCPREDRMAVHDENRLANLVRQAFSHRRKTLRNALGAMITASQFESACVDSSARAENLDVQDFIRLANA